VRPLFVSRAPAAALLARRKEGPTEGKGARADEQLDKAAGSLARRDSCFASLTRRIAAAAENSCGRGRLQQENFENFSKNRKNFKKVEVRFLMSGTENSAYVAPAFSRESGFLLASPADGG